MIWPTLILGILIGTLGWLLYWAGLSVIGALVGAGAGGALGFLLSGFMPAVTWAQTVLTALGGVIGLVVGIGLIRVFQTWLFFFAGAALGAACFFSLSRHPSVAEFVGPPGSLLPFLIVVTFGIIGGAVMVRLRRYVIAVVTSFIGTALVLQGASPGEPRPLLAIACLVAFIAIQTGLVKRFVDQEAFDARTRHKLREDRPASPPPA